MAYRLIQVTPLAGALGAEVSGVDLGRELADETFAEIHHAFLGHQVIFFRDQALRPEQQLAFARRFGPPIVDPFIQSPTDRPDLMVVVKDTHEKHAFGNVWHSDSTFLERPPAASILYALEVPPYGGDTLFASQYLAYETLSAGLRAVLDGLDAVHGAASYNQSIAAGRFGPERTMKLRGDDVMRAAMAGEVAHPVVRSHPETGRKALYVNAAYTLRFQGMTAEESRPLLEFLYAHAVRPEFTCRFRWTPGALACWDNRCVQHYPINDYAGQRRVMHRVVAEGDRPS
jgi:taurine dioxygenase